MWIECEILGKDEGNGQREVFPSQLVSEQHAQNLFQRRMGLLVGSREILTADAFDKYLEAA